MQPINFNDDWLYRRISGEPTSFAEITLPHDAMLFEGRDPSSAGEHNVSFFSGGDYEYVKTFFAPSEIAGKKIFFEFEGVYRNAEIYLNGEKIAFRPYGYVGFFVEAKVRAGEQNELKVVARNSAQPNSRWYTGSGIYRDVNMYIAPEKHILPNGLKVTTLSISPPTVEVRADRSGAGEAEVTLCDELGKEVARGKTADGKVTFSLENAELWSPENPRLYTAKAVFGEDTASANFGIRQIGCDPEKGFTINGERVILNGACIHHDNGILGACAYKTAEERKIRLLKELGYNAVRSAHNPCSKYMLDYCDRIGMLVLDEYADMWYIHKTEFDYAEYLTEYFRTDLKDITDRDYNHPSVIMYSTGNEVAETSQKRGIALTGEMTKYLHELDPTRPVTCGVNIFFNFLFSVGLGVYSDKKAKKDSGSAGKKKKKVGSEFFNHIAGIFGDKTMKLGATLHGCDVKTRDAFANMDVAGYNYGILRYRKDLKKYPKRLILGTETFCKDAAAFRALALKHERIVGDFVWAGMDYLGEAGIGAWEYKDYAPVPSGNFGWITAGSGRLDITGDGSGEAAYTRVVYGKQKIAFAVVPVDATKDRHSPSAWKMTNAKTSWAWDGCEGRTAKIEVYTLEKTAALYINGKLVGKKNVGKSGRVVFKTKYRSGEATAIAYDENGREVARESMRSAGTETQLSLLPETPVAEKGELLYVRIAFTDAEKNIKPLARDKVEVIVDGGKLLGLGSGCPYNDGNFLSSVTDTYYGQALAVIKPTADAVTVSASSGKFGSSTILITAVV